MSERRKILAIAYACDPCKGSESGVGWGWVRMLARNNDVTVITAEYNRASLERAANEDRTDGLTFKYVTARPWHYRPNGPWRFVENSCFKPFMNLAYNDWLNDAYRLATRIQQKSEFDLAHLITYVGFRFPGKFYRLGIPFIWGPIGGLENTPWNFLPMLGAGGALFFAGRNVINSLQRRMLIGPKKAFRAASGIIAATGGIRREIQRFYHRDSDVICEIGPPDSVASDHAIRRDGEPIRMSWSGLHEPGKALPILLGALGSIGTRIDWRLSILGEGPCSSQWKRLAESLSIGSRCEWKGWLPRADAVREMHSSHLFVITSIKDLTSTVLLEALSQGVPVIAPDHCGFSDVITADCGIKVPVRTPKQLEADLAGAIVRLASDEPERQRLARGALARIQDFSWEKKAAAVDAIYRRVLANKSEPGHNGQS